MPLLPLSRREPGARLPALRRVVRRHRRGLAALVAAVAMVVGLGSLRAGPADAGAAAASAASTPGVAPGQVAVPIVLSSAAVTRTLGVGDVVDIVGVTGDESATATVVAPRVRIIDVPDSGSSFTSSGAGVIIVAVDEAHALPLIAASASGALSVLIRST